MEGVSLKILSQSIEEKIRASVYSYRYNRSKPVLIQNAVRALIGTVMLAIILVFLLWLLKKINLRLQNRIKKRIESVENIFFNLIKSEQMWRIFHVLFGTLKTIVIIMIVIVFIDYVLALFPWTNAFSKYILQLIIDPLKDIGNAFLNYIPKLMFLVFIYIITKYILKLINLLFVGIEVGNITIKGFNAEWASPTFKIVRIFLIVFAVIISYPYIPGSDSVAFKGVSVFFGVLLSLGSSSIIGNIVAGYSMIYRGAFKRGDIIEVNDQIGVVEEQKMMITRLRSFKNEEILIPNSILLNSKIINYRAKANEFGIILYTTVGIGYETSWRQVDAMLKVAANRTAGILKNPPPFVLKK